VDKANWMPGSRLITRSLKCMGLLSVCLLSGLPVAGPAAMAQSVKPPLTDNPLQQPVRPSCPADRQDSDAPAHRRFADDGPLTFGDAICGRLDDSDERLPANTLGDTYTVSLRAGEAIQISMSADGFAPYIGTFPPQNGQRGFRPVGVVNNVTAHAWFTAPATGSYRIVASSQTFGRGLYRLQVHRMPQ
jgi:hypothetical protein